jgi:uncharacterized protein YjgD (DUF1641 family)
MTKCPVCKVQVPTFDYCSFQCFNIGEKKKNRILEKQSSSEEAIQTLKGLSLMSNDVKLLSRLYDALAEVEIIQKAILTEAQSQVISRHGR